MLSDFLQTGGSGGIGAIVGTVFAAFGFRRRLERLEEKIVYRDAWEAEIKGLTKRLDSQGEMIKEMRLDIKQLVRNKVEGK